MIARLTLVAMLLAGCAAGSYVLTGTKRPPIDPASVRIYASAPEGAEEVALLDSNSGGAFAFSDQGKLDAAIARMKQDAASLGANGIVIRGTGTESTGGVIVGTGAGMAIYGGARHKAAAGIAIYVPSTERP